MATLTVYDPPMCCATGVCGPDVDQRLVDLAADLDWLKAQGVSVRRISLSQEPAEFAANDKIRQLMHDSDGDDLPAFLADGALVARARYPSRAELAAWTGVGAPEAQLAARERELVALGAAIGAGCEPCLTFHVGKARETGLTVAEIRAAVAVARRVGEASAKNIAMLAERLAPDAPRPSACCGGARAEPAAASGCCGGPTTAAETKQAGGCC